jgi:hypothetical protein
MQKQSSPQRKCLRKPGKFHQLTVSPCQVHTTNLPSDNHPRAFVLIETRKSLTGQRTYRTMAVARLYAMRRSGHFTRSTCCCYRSLGKFESLICSRFKFVNTVSTQCRNTVVNTITLTKMPFRRGTSNYYSGC